MSREGNKYKVVKAGYFNKGDVVEMIRDDGTSMPMFKCKNSGQVAWEHMYKVEELKGEKKMEKKVVGKKYEVIKDGHLKFNVGDIIELKYDDGSNEPKFKRVSDGLESYVSMARVKLLKDKTPKIGKKYVVTGTRSHYFAKGEVVTYVSPYGSDGEHGNFVNKDGRTQIVLFSEVEKLAKPLKVGKKAVVISTEKTSAHHGYNSSMAKVGEEIVIHKITPDYVTATKVGGGGAHFTYHIDDVKRKGITPEEVIEKAKPRFQKGDIVKIIGNTNHSCNKVGDIGVIITDVKEGDSFRVKVPNRVSSSNWTRHSDAEPTGLKGEVK